jgi:ATP-dependent RecD-like DNA helicase SH3 domain
VERFGWTFATGDKVMQIENDYDKEVYNGDIGYIDDVNPNEGEVVASFDGRSVTYRFGELDMLVPAYAAIKIGAPTIVRTANSDGIFKWAPSATAAGRANSKPAFGK